MKKVILLLVLVGAFSSFSQVKKPSNNDGIVFKNGKDLSATFEKWKHMFMEKYSEVKGRDLAWNLFVEEYGDVKCDEMLENDFSPAERKAMNSLSDTHIVKETYYLEALDHFQSLYATNVVNVSGDCRVGVVDLKVQREATAHFMRLLDESKLN